MRHPSRWGAAQQQHHQHHQPRRRRGTMVTESTRFSIASSSNKFSCVDIDSEGCGACEWDVSDTHVVPILGQAAAAAAAASPTLQAATFNQNINSSTPMKKNKGGRELPRQQKQATVTGSVSKTNTRCPAAFSKLLTSPSFPWKKKQQRSSTSYNTQTAATATKTATTTSSPSPTAIIHESKLRKKVQHYARNDDWDSIRNLLSKHPFSNIIPEKVVTVSDKRRGSSSYVGKSKHDAHSQSISPAWENDASHGKNRYRRRSGRSNRSIKLSVPGSGHPHADGSGRDDGDDDDDDDVNGSALRNTTCRRPSYESYSSGRRSFTGKESAAAAAAIQHAAMFDCESSEDSCDDHGDNEGIGGERERSRARCRTSHTTSTTTRDDRPDIGDNILHDICRYQPPLDVLEIILSGLRDRYQGQLYMIGTDYLGRTPLHVAAAHGAHWTIIDALVRVDPTPASMGDAHSRSPLHLAVKKRIGDWEGTGGEPKPGKQRWRRHWWGKYPHYRQDSCKDCRKTSEQTPDEIFRIVHLLKDSMLTYPGKIDFSDEDRMGYSPLDYAIESGIAENSLIRALIQRNYRHNFFCSLSCSDSLQLVRSRSDCKEEHATTASIDSKIVFLEELDHCEKDAIIAKIQKLNPSRLKIWMEYEPFKFLMDREDELLLTRRGPPTSAGGNSIIANDVVATTKPSTEGERPSSSPRVETSCQLEPPRHAYLEKSSKEVNLAIYNKHLQDYFDGYMQELELGDIQHYDQCDHDDGFDIFVDPEEWDYENDPDCTAMLLMNGASSRPLSEISVVEDDDCVSVLTLK